jgi:DNA repair protein RecN (Recombination protein N)
VRQRLRDLGLNDEDEEICIKRVISKEGRGRVYINGSPATAVMLHKVTEGLLELVGQGEHQSLLRPEGQLELLDAYGGHGELRRRMADAYVRWRDLAERKRKLEESERERQNREEFLAFQIKEIEDARLKPGEDENLAREREKLRHVAKIMSSARAAEAALYGGETSAVDLLRAAIQRLRDVAGLDAKLAEWHARVETARVEIEDVARDLDRYATSLEHEDGRLQEIDDRMTLIHKLSRKHGAGAEAILERLAELKAEYTEVTGQTVLQQKIDGEIDAARRDAEEIARRLSHARREAAARFGSSISEVLAKMGMLKARLEATVGKFAYGPHDLVIDESKLGPTGADRVEMSFAPNLGEGFKPLHRVASGGELSRVTLAAKVVLAQADPTSTSVYDEVDTGVGGRTARVLGELLRDGAKGRQVLCITHLAQVAAYAETHLLVEKREVGGRVVSGVRPLDVEERVSELARMMGGGSATVRSLAHAEELLRESQGNPEPRPVPRAGLSLVV